MAAGPGCSLQHFISSFVDVLNARGLDLEQFLLQQPRDLNLGFLDGELVGRLDGQEEFTLALGDVLAGGEVGAPDSDTGVRVLADLRQGFFGGNLPSGLLELFKKKTNTLVII